MSTPTTDPTPGPMTDADLDADRITDVEFADVPPVGRDGEVDPHWLDLRGSSELPVAYMPPSMAGSRAGWVRVVAVVVAAVFVVATAGGVCLTYGPPATWF